MHVVACALTERIQCCARMSSTQAFASSPYPINRSEQNFNPHQWPWRLIAFASDLGSIGYLLKKPALGIIGGLIALPYYAYSIARKKTPTEKKDEFLYQATANGIFPLLEAKLGICLGRFINGFFKQANIKTLAKATPNTWKIAGGIISVTALTPTIGDPLARKLLNPFVNQPN